MTGTIRRDRLHDQVTRALAVRILSGSLTPGGDSSTEMDLCRELGVSRTILREAIKVLSAKGLVDVRPKTGVRIKPRSEWNVLDPTLLMWQTELGVDQDFIKDFCQVRLILEPPTAAAAATSATTEERENIHRIYLEMERLQNDFPAFIEVDCEFHSAISTATHNRFLIQMNRLVANALRGTQNIHKDRRNPKAAAKALEMHKEIAEAILHRDPNAAHDAMVRMIARAERDIYLAVEKTPEKTSSKSTSAGAAS